jgi:phosphatidylserine decarboxylase
MPSRPTLTSKFSLPHRLKNNNHSNNHGGSASVPTSRNTSPRRNMSDPTKQGLVLKTSVLKVGYRECTCF